MKERRIQTRSLLAGAILGVAITASIGATLKHTGQIGRFQLSVGAGPAFVIDTVSGQVWIQQGHGQGAFFDPKAEAVTLKNPGAN